MWLAPLLATLATLVVGFIVFAALGKDPVAAFTRSSSSPSQRATASAELLLKATPLMLIATGLARSAFAPTSGTSAPKAS